MLLLIISILIKTNRKAAAMTGSLLPLAGLSVFGIRVIPQRARK